MKSKDEHNSNYYDGHEIHHCQTAAKDTLYDG